MTVKPSHSYTDALSAKKGQKTSQNMQINNNADIIEAEKYEGRYSLEKMHDSGIYPHSRYLIPTRRNCLEAKLKYSRDRHRQMKEWNSINRSLRRAGGTADAVSSFYPVSIKGSRPLQHETRSIVRNGEESEERGENRGRLIDRSEGAKHVKTEHKKASKKGEASTVQSSQDRSRRRCLANKSGKKRTLRFRFNLKHIIILVLLVLRLFNIDTTKASTISPTNRSLEIKTSNIWLYEESFYVIRSDISLIDLKTNIQKINRQIEKMRSAKMDFDISFDEAEQLKFENLL